MNASDKSFCERESLCALHVFLVIMSNIEFNPVSPASARALDLESLTQ